MAVNPVGIILVVFKQRHNLELLYKSLSSGTYSDFKIYFVDNNQDDEDKNFSYKINEVFKLNIVYLKPGYNSGFAGGNNAGAEQAIKDGCKYIFFLNNDSILDKGCIQKLVDSIEKDGNIGAAGPLILYGDGSIKDPLIQEVGEKVNFKSYKIRKHFEGDKYNVVKAELPETIESDMISGGAFFVRQEVLKKTGLWEEDYFAYGDEIDLAKRIKDAGYKIIAVSSSILYHNHKWNKKNKQGFYFEYYLIERNKFLYFYKYKLYTSIILSLLIDSFKFPIRLIWFIKVCDFKLGIYYLRGMLAGLFKRKGIPPFQR